MSEYGSVPVSAEGQEGEGAATARLGRLARPVTADPPSSEPKPV